MKKMKRYYFLGLLLMGMMFLFASCEPDKKSFNPALMEGYWLRNSTEYYYYNSDGTGYTWDESDDVMESEAQNFTWTLSGDQLRLVHKLESSNAVVPKVYTVTELTSSLLEYSDVYGKIYSYHKVNRNK